MSGEQRIILCGHLGANPEMRYIPSGTAVTTFSIATDRTYTKDKEKVKETCWFRVTCWGKQAEACAQFLEKGSLAWVEGVITPDPKTGGPRIWADKEGMARANFEVNASTVRFLSNPNKQKDSVDEYNDNPTEDF